MLKFLEYFLDMINSGNFSFMFSHTDYKWASIGVVVKLFKLQVGLFVFRDFFSWLGLADRGANFLWPISECRQASGANRSHSQVRSKISSWDLQRNPDGNEQGPMSWRTLVWELVTVLTRRRTGRATTRISHSCKVSYKTSPLHVQNWTTTSFPFLLRHNEQIPIQLCAHNAHLRSERKQRYIFLFKLVGNLSFLSHVSFHLGHPLLAK